MKLGGGMPHHVASAGHVSGSLSTLSAMKSVPRFTTCAPCLNCVLLGVLSVINTN